MTSLWDNSSYISYICTNVHCTCRDPGICTLHYARDAWYVRGAFVCCSRRGSPPEPVGSVGQGLDTSMGPYVGPCVAALIAAVCCSAWRPSAGDLTAEYGFSEQVMNPCNLPSTFVEWLNQQPPVLSLEMVLTPDLVLTTRISTFSRPQAVPP